MPKFEDLEIKEGSHEAAGADAGEMPGERGASKPNLPQKRYTFLLPQNIASLVAVQTSDNGDRIKYDFTSEGLAAYDGDEVVGYAVSIIAPSHLHYADLCYVSNDALFVKKSHRGGSTGLRLMRETERIAKERGAKLVLWHAKEGTRLDALLTRLGYGVQDIIFSKEL